MCCCNGLASSEIFFDCDLPVERDSFYEEESEEEESFLDHILRKMGPKPRVTRDDLSEETRGELQKLQKKVDLATRNGNENELLQLNMKVAALAWKNLEEESQEEWRRCFTVREEENSLRVLTIQGKSYFYRE